MNRLCVYCGSSAGAGDDYAATAKELGRLLVQQEIGLVYGGSNLGLMGTIADTVLEGGGNVTGIIPQALHGKEIAHSGLTELHVVDSMHERKSLMAVLSDGFIAMPGGFGTLEEIIEVMLFRQAAGFPRPFPGGRVFASTTSQHAVGGDHAGRPAGAVYGLRAADHREVALGNELRIYALPAQAPAAAT
jgi:uncharacterized protein (TIGR00730 family)